MTRPFYLFIFSIFALFILSGCSIFPEQLSLKKHHDKDFTVEKETHTMVVTATAYTSCRRETDKTPYLAAWNNRLKPSVKSIAVSRDLLPLGVTNGTKVRIDGLKGTYVVLDKMNKRWKKKIDIYMGCNLKKARHWGKRKVTIHWTKKTIEPKKSNKQAKKKS